MLWRFFGTAITIATDLDSKYLAAIERLIGQSITVMDIDADEERAKARHGRGKPEGTAAEGDGKAEGETRGARRSSRRRGRKGSSERGGDERRVILIVDVLNPYLPWWAALLNHLIVGSSGYLLPSLRALHQSILEHTLASQEDRLDSLPTTVYQTWKQHLES